MDEKKITGLTEEEQAWIDLDVTWGENNPTVKKAIERAREGERMSLTSLKGWIRTRKQEVLAMQKALDAEKKSKADDEAKKCGQKQQRQLFLPGVGETLAAQPNALARSSLFAPLRSDFTVDPEKIKSKSKKEKRKMYNCEALVSRKDVKIEYSGVQLTEDHADLCMELVKLQIESGLEVGEFVDLTRANVLKRLGWGTGGQSYRKFHGCMKELAAATLFLEAFNADGSPKYTLGDKIGATDVFRLVRDFKNTEGGESYCFQLHPGWFKLFANNEYALINWDIRKQINSRLPLAKTLQRIIATSRNSPQRYLLSFLKDLTQDTARVREFRTKLGTALDELRRIGFITDWSVGLNQKKKEQVVIWVKEYAPADTLDGDYEEI